MQGAFRLKVPKITKQDREARRGFCGSSAYSGRFFAWPEDYVLLPILRTVLPEFPQVAARTSQAVLDDVLMHELHFEKNENFFVGDVHGRRVVLFRLAGDQYGIASPDQNVANQILLLLRSFDIQVTEIKE